MGTPVDQVFAKQPSSKVQNKSEGTPVSAVFQSTTAPEKSSSSVMDRLSKLWTTQSSEPTVKQQVGGSPPEVDSGLKRGLAWVESQLDETDYGKTYKQQVLAAEDQMQSGVEHMQHAQGPLAPVEGLGGLAQVSLGAIAYLFSPVTTLVEEGAAKPVKELTQSTAEKLAPKDSKERERFLATAGDVQDIEDFAIQSAAGMETGELARPKIDPAAAKAARDKISSSFNELAAKDPEAAEALAEHVGQVDENMRAWMRAKIDKYRNASDRELNALGKEAAQAEIDRAMLGTGENRASKSGRKSKSAPSGYGEVAASEGLSTGEGRASPGKSKTRSAPSGYGEELITPPDAGDIDSQLKDFMEGQGLAPAISSEKASALVRNAAKDAQESIKGAVPNAVEQVLPDRAQIPIANHWSDFDANYSKIYDHLGAHKAVVKVKDLLDSYEDANKKLAGLRPLDQTPKMNKLLFDALRKYAGDVEIHFDKELRDFVGADGKVGKASGFYHAATHKIEIFTDHSTVTHSVLHEAVHAGTVRFMHNNPSHMLTKRMENLRRVAEKYAKKSGQTHYGLADVYEFVAEAMISATFQKFLSKVPLKTSGTLYSRFVDAVKEIFGLKGKDARMLEIALRTTEDIMAAQKQMLEDRKTGSVDGARNQPVYYNEVGKPVTRGEIEEKANFGPLAAPGIEIARSKMAGLYESYIKTFNPEAMGAKARAAGAAIARNFFELARRDLKYFENGKVRREFFQKLGPEKSFEFIMQAETGRKFDNPILETMRRGYQTWSDEMFAQDQRTGLKEYTYVDHYMPHMFEDKEAVVYWMQKQFGTKWADPSFVRRRGFSLYEEAVKAGHKPLFKNPEELMQARQHSSDLAATRADIFREMGKLGAAKLAEKDETIPPPGFNGQTYRSPTGERYWIHHEAVPLVKNALDSESLWQKKGFGGDTFRTWMAAKNQVVSMKLGLSLFHPMHIMHIDAAAGMARATARYAGGNMLNPLRAGRFIIDMAKSIPYTTNLLTSSLNAKSGYPLLRVFQGKMRFEDLSLSDQQAFKDLAETGMVPIRPQEETMQSWQKLKDTWYTQGMKNPAGLAWHFTGALMQGISHPIYSVWIPSLKIASVLKDMKVARELNPDWTAEQRQLAARQIARKVEARYGEMNYQSMFMNKIYKDIGVATNLSLGWNLGLIDQYVGGAVDLGKAGLMKGGLRGKLASGLLDRPIFAAYYIGSAMLLGGLMHKFFTGKNPDSLIDYTHPESGEVDKFGKPVRLNTMFYTREFEGLSKRIETEGSYDAIKDFIANKGSGMASMAISAVSGIDGLGQHFRDENDPVYKKFLDTLAYEMSDVEPIALKALSQGTSNPTKMTTLSVLGFTPAGKYISETPVEGKIETAYNKYVRPREKSYTAAQIGKDKEKARQAWNTDDSKYEDYLNSMVEKYDMSPKEVKQMEKQFAKGEDFDPSVFMFKRLQWDQQKPILDEMEPEQREEYLRHVSKEKRAKYLRETEK